MNYVGNAVDNGDAVDVIYLDFQKAFVKVPHRRLLLKLVSHGISGKVIKYAKTEQTAVFEKKIKKIYGHIDQSSMKESIIAVE